MNTAKCQVGVCVCLEGVHQEYGKHIIDEQIHASLFGQECDSANHSRWFVDSVTEGCFRNAESTLVNYLHC